MSMLRDHQERAVEFLLNKGSGAIFYEIGTGKTFLTLSYFQERIKTEKLRLIVICPVSLIEAAWGEDIKKFTNLTYQNLHDDFSISEKYDVYILNYESLFNKRNFQRLSTFLSHYPCMGVLDESARLKNHKSKTAKNCLALRDRFKYRVILTGMPAPNIETEYYAQMEFVAPGIFGHSFYRFGHSFYRFRNTFFHLERGGQMMIQQGTFMTRSQAKEIFSKGWKYAITPQNRTRLMNIINPYCIMAKKKDCLDLPEEIDEMRYVELPSEHWAQYREMKRELVLEIKNQIITAPVALTKLQKLREITSGFIYNDKGEAIELSSSPKMTELKEILEQSGGQAIIWCQFKWEIETIQKEIGGVTLYSGTKDREASINDFISSKAKYLIAHPKSAAHGLTFINCSVQVFFSLDFSLEGYVQARGRTHRLGQKNSCVYIHILAKDTIDEYIFEVLSKKTDVQEAVEKLLK